MVGRDAIEPPTPGFSDRPAPTRKYAEVLYVRDLAPLLIGFHWFSLVHHRHSRAQNGHTTTHSFGFAVFGIDLARTTSLRLRTP